MNNDEWLQKYYESYGNPDYEKPADVLNVISNMDRAKRDTQLLWICQSITKENCQIIHDYGCGAGRLLVALNDNCITKQHNFFYLGIDTDVNILSKAHELSKKLKIENKCKFLTPKEWRFQSELYQKHSAVIMNDTIHHMSHEQISNFLNIFSSLMRPTVPLIIGEVALFKKIEPYRIPLSNLDWNFLCAKLGLAIKAQYSFSPKGLPLVRVILKVPKNRHNRINFFEIDSILRETFENKLKNLDLSLKLWRPELGTPKTRIGMLEAKHNLSQLLAHWSDRGEFIQIEPKLESQHIERNEILTAIKDMVDREVVIVINGKHGVGKTSLLHKFIHSYKKSFLAATATFSSNETTMGSWVLKEAKEKKYEDLLSLYQEFSKTPDMWFENIIQTLAKLQILLIIDNSHLCERKFICRLQNSCSKYNCNLLLISSLEFNLSIDKDKNSKNLSINGFTQSQTTKWLKQNVGRSYSKTRVYKIWRDCGNGNPQRLEMRFKANLESLIPDSFGKISDIDFTVVCASMLQPEGLRESELIKITNCDIKTIKSIKKRRLLNNRGDFLTPHDIVAGMIIRLLEFDSTINILRKRFCDILTSKYHAIKIRDRRISQNESDDILRFCNQLRLQGRYKQAWKILEAISYSVYMDGDYDKLLNEIEASNNASPNTYQPEINHNLFWLWLRKGRILKRQGLLSEARKLFSLLQKNSLGRRQLATIKELAEIARLEGNIDLSIRLFKDAKKLDEKWAKNKRDKMITLKQLGVTLCEKGQFNKAEKLILQSLHGRKQNDRYGIASCKRYLSYITYCRIKAQKKLTKKQRVFLITEAWENAQFALEIFHQENDFEGRSGTTDLICKIGNYALNMHELKTWRIPVKHILNQYYQFCFEHHKAEIKKLFHHQFPEIFGTLR